MSEERRSVLLVDDLETLLEMSAQMLLGRGLEIRTARSGQEALSAIRTAPPDMVFLDLMMPGLDGVETCRLLKSDPATCEIPIVMLTALKDPKSVERAFDAGCDDYITKPLDKLEMLDKIDCYLG